VQRIADLLDVTAAGAAVAGLDERGLPHRVESIVVLTYVNPMWLANWDAPELGGRVEVPLLASAAPDVLVTSAAGSFPFIFSDNPLRQNRRPVL
jgi:hypothetical protein